jgi:hypothetical protein
MNFINPNSYSSIEDHALGRDRETGPVCKVEDVITLDPEQTEVDLNHGRIGKIENFEPLVKLER